MATTCHWVTMSTALMCRGRDPVLIALIDGVDVNEVGQSLERRGAAHADAAGSALGLDEVAPLLLVERLRAQVVPVGHRDAGQSGVARIAAQPPGWRWIGAPGAPLSPGG